MSSLSTRLNTKTIFDSLILSEESFKGLGALTCIISGGGTQIAFVGRGTHLQCIDYFVPYILIMKAWEHIFEGRDI